MRCLLRKLTGTLLLLCCFCVQIRSESLYRDRSGQFRDAVSKVHTEILNTTNAGVLLKCELIEVFPRVEVRWQDNDGTTIPFFFSESCYRGDVCDVSITAHVTKTETNIFTCMVRQPEIYHELKQKVYVPDKMFQVLKDDSSSDITGKSTEVLIGLVIAALLVGLVIGGVTGVLVTPAVTNRRRLSAKCGCVESVESDDVASEQHSSTESQLPLCGDGGSRGENP